MHDREHAGRLVVVALDAGPVAEQAHDAPVAEARGGARRVDRVDLAGLEHRRQRLAVRGALDADRGRQVDRRLLDAPGLVEAAGHVGHAVDREAVVLGQDPADPDIGRELVLGHAHPSARQVGGDRAGAVGRDVDPRVAKRARWEHRDGHERRPLLLQGQDVGRQRHLRGVELTMAHHPKERLLRRRREVDEVDALGAHVAAGQRARAVVVPARERQRATARRHPRAFRADRTPGTCSSGTVNSPSTSTGSSSRETEQPRIGMSMWAGVSLLPPSSWLGPRANITLP